MCRVFLYSRVSTSAQTLAQQERTVYEWLDNHNMKVDVIVSDEGVSGGVSYADRKLGKELLPMMKEGDVLIVSEVSRLGRSMFDLSKLIHEELKPRKLRLIVVGMGIDLNCAKITPIDQLILSNFSFAAELEKHLIRERTLSALQVRKNKGIKLGGASDKWRESFENKTQEQKDKEHMKKGKTRNSRHLEDRSVSATFKVLRNVFPEATKDEDPAMWTWAKISCGYDNRMKILSMMKDYKSIDPTLFPKWNFDDMESNYMMHKLASWIQSLRKSAITRRENETNK